MKAIYNCNNHNFLEWIKENASADEVIFQGIMPFDEACDINHILDCLNGKTVDISDYNISLPQDKRDYEASLQDVLGRYVREGNEQFMWLIICSNKEFATRYTLLLDKGYVISEDGRVYLQEKDTGEVHIPESVRVIGHFAFSNDWFILGDTLVLPKELEVVGIYGLDFVHDIDSIPESISRLGIYAFQSGHEIGHFCVPKNVKVIPEGCFNCCSVPEEIWVPEGVEVIEYNAFDIDASHTIHLPSTLKELDDMFYYEDCIGSGDPPYIEVDERNPYFYAVDGTLYKRGEKTPYLGFKYEKTNKYDNTPTSTPGRPTLS